MPLAPFERNRRHVQAVALLHGAVSVMIAAAVVLLWMAAAELAPLFHGSFVPELLAWLGRPVAIACLLLAAIGLAGAIGLWRHRRWARWPLIAVSVLLLWVFPIGTAMAVYTFWVLGRQPQMQPPESDAA
jgi:hypothetical protein